MYILDDANTCPAPVVKSRKSRRRTLSPNEAVDQGLHRCRITCKEVFFFYFYNSHNNEVPRERDYPTEPATFVQRLPNVFQTPWMFGRLEHVG